MLRERSKTLGGHVLQVLTRYDDADQRRIVLGLASLDEIGRFALLPRHFDQTRELHRQLLHVGLVHLLAGQGNAVRYHLHVIGEYDLQTPTGLDVVRPLSSHLVYLHVLDVRVFDLYRLVLALGYLVRRPYPRRIRVGVRAQDPAILTACHQVADKQRPGIRMSRLRLRECFIHAKGYASVAVVMTSLHSGVCVDVEPCFANTVAERQVLGH